MDTRELLEGADGATGPGSDVAAAYGDEMQSLPAQARVTHIPLLGHRIATTGFLVHEDAYYWLLPPRHVYRMNDDGEREPFDLAMTVIEAVTRKACACTAAAPDSSACVPALWAEACPQPARAIQAARKKCVR